MLVDQFLQVDAHRELIHAGLLHVAGDAIELRSGVLRRSESFEPLRAVLDDQRHAGQRLDVLHDSRSAECADDRRERRLHARLAAVALDRLDESGLFAADVSTRATCNRHVEVEVRSEDPFAEEASGARFVESFVENRRRVVELAANVDVPHRIRSDRVRRDDHPFEEKVRILLHDHAVLERARLGFVGVAEQPRRLRRVLRNEAPLHAGRESRAAAAAQFGVLHELGDLVRRHLQRFPRSFVAAAVDVGLDRRGIRLIDVREEDFDWFHYLSRVRSSSILRTSIFS